MLSFWAVVILLGALAVIDVHRAYLEYQRDKKVLMLAVHGVLLVGLSAVVVNTVLVALGAESDLPYIETHIKQNDPQYLKTHEPRGKHALLKSLKPAHEKGRAKSTK